MSRFGQVVSSPELRRVRSTLQAQKTKEVQVMEPLQSGYVRKLRKGAQWKKRWINLTPRGWSYYKNPSDATPLRIIKYEGNMVIGNAFGKKGEARLAFSAPYGQFLFQLLSNLQLETWKKSLRQAIRISKLQTSSIEQKYEIKENNDNHFLFNLNKRKNKFKIWLNNFLEYDSKDSESIKSITQIVNEKILQKIQETLIDQQRFLEIPLTEEIENKWNFEFQNHQQNEFVKENEIPSKNLLALIWWFKNQNYEILPNMENVIKFLQCDQIAILDFVWCIILLYYQPHSKIIKSKFKTKTRDDFLNWCSCCFSNFFPGVNIEFQSFHFFQDVSMLNSIIHYFLPDDIPALDHGASFSLHSPDFPLALEIIYSYLEMVNLLDEFDFRKSIDEFSIILFVLEFERIICLTREAELTRTFFGTFSKMSQNLEVKNFDDMDFVCFFFFFSFFCYFFVNFLFFYS